MIVGIKIHINYLKAAFYAKFYFFFRKISVTYYFPFTHLILNYCKKEEIFFEVK